MGLYQKLKTMTDETRRLRFELQGAMKFNNAIMIRELSYKLSINNAKIVDLVMDRLERVQKPDAGGYSDILTTTVNSNINITKDTPVDINLDTPDRAE